MPAVPAVPFSEIETEDWPLVRVRVVRAPHNDREIDTFQQQFIALLQLAATGSAKGIPPCRLYILFNLDGIVDATFAQKRRACRFVTAVRTYAATAIAATALVTTNQLAQLILMALLAIVTLVSENKLFSSNEAGLVWLQAKMDGRPAAGGRDPSDPGALGVDPAQVRSLAEGIKELEASGDGGGGEPGDAAAVDTTTMDFQTFIATAGRAPSLEK